MKMTWELWAGLILVAVGGFLLYESKKAEADPTGQAPSIFAGSPQLNPNGGLFG